MSSDKPQFNGSELAAFQYILDEDPAFALEEVRNMLPNERRRLREQLRELHDVLTQADTEGAMPEWAKEG